MDRPAWTADASVQALTDIAPDALVVVDTQGCILLVNSLAERLFGYQRAELVGQTLERLVPERYRAAQAPHLAAYVASPSPRAMDRSLNIIGQRKDGSEFPADVTLRPLPTQAGLVMVGAIRDMTERKRLEDERAALLAREQAARAQAEAAVRLRDAFLAAVTHDLKNPLSTISMWAEVLQQLSYEVGPPETAEQVRTGAGRIVATSSKVVTILQELLDVARLQMGQPLSLERAPTDLVVLAQRIVAEHQGPHGRHVLRLQVRERDLLGWWDAGRLERVLDNLLDNAIKYSPEGGEITVRLSRQDESAVVAVTDHGIGIPARDLPHIFEWFQRGSNVAGRHGAGLGLAGVRQLVEQHGGTIAVASREGVGSTFTVRLPLAVAPVGQAREAVKLRAARPTPRHSKLRDPASG